ncbi:hypothetical protein JCM5296_000468 [Sporobolomyces johnsonii]
MFGFARACARLRPPPPSLTRSHPSSLTSFSRPLSSSAALSSRALQPADKRTKRPGNPSITRSNSGSELDSYKLSATVLRLASQSRWLDALTLVHTSPPRAATVVVWNVLLNAILQARDSPDNALNTIKRAYDVWMDMKRRGVVPSARSYGTFLGGVAKIVKRMEARKGASETLMVGAEVRAKVETVHKQWRMHCAKVLEASERTDKGPGFALLGGQRVEMESSTPAKDNGELDTPSDLSAHPTNQYLAFLSSCFALSAAKEPSSATAATLFDQVLSTFQATPLADSGETNARDAVSYALVFNALRICLQASLSAAPPAPPAPPSPPAPSTTPTPPAAAIEDDPLSPTPSSLPSTTALLETAFALWDSLLSSPLPPSSPLTPALSTSFLSLFLLPPPSTLSIALQQRTIALLPSIFGLVPPSQLADLQPPHPPTLVQPMCDPALDSGALKVCLALLARWNRFDQVEGVWTQVREYPERYFGGNKTGTVETEHAEIVLQAFAAKGDASSAEALLNHLITSSAHEPDLAPALSTFELALEASWRHGAIETAWRIWALLSPPSPSDSPSSTRAPKATFTPSPRAAAYLLLTALSTRDRSQIWRALKELGFTAPTSSLFGPGVFPPPPGARPAEAQAQAKASSKKAQENERKAEQRAELWRGKLAHALRIAVQRITHAPGGDTTVKDQLEPDVVRRLEAWGRDLERWMQAREEKEGGEGEGEGKGESEGERDAALKHESMASRRAIVAAREAARAAEAEAAAEAEKVGRRARRDKWWSEKDEMERERVRSEHEGQRRARWEAGKGEGRGRIWEGDGGRSTAKWDRGREGRPFRPGGGGFARGKDGDRDGGQRRRRPAEGAQLKKYEMKKVARLVKKYEKEDGIVRPWRRGNSVGDGNTDE